ncbi:MAG: FixH family protein [Alphaproteobacteria bacterium]|nr:FixH family protein [Alphaproteobacteria bacterium]
MIRELKGFHVLLMILTFFGVTFAVNIALATFAISSFSGEDVSTPYQRGLEYNQTLAARSAQRDLGWTATISLARDAKTNGVVAVSIVGKDGAPRSGLKVEAMLRRPTDAKFDQTIALQSVGDGEYRAAVGTLAEGQWDVIARSAAEDGTPFEAQRRFVLQ